MLKDEKTQYYKNANSPTLTYKLSPIPTVLFIESEKCILIL